MSAPEWDLREFAKGYEAGSLRRRTGRASLLLVLFLALIGGGLTWASVARIEEFARATGRVVPSGQARTVESLEGGIIRDIDVAEGDVVAAGQVLARIDDTGSSASLGELAAKEQALVARSLRLDAELAGAEAVDFTESGIAPDSPLAVQEVAIFDSRAASYFGERAVLEAQARQRQLEISELASGMARMAEGLALLEEEITLKTDSGVIPRAQILPLERELSGRRQEQDTLASRQDKAEAALSEAEARLTEADLKRRAEISMERSDTLNQLNVIRESIRRADDVVSRAALRAPVDGVVAVLNVHTVGAVIAPGEEVLRIVPLDDRLQVEARARPEDIAFIRPGLPASVKLTSFDFTIYGALEGHVVRIGADAEQDKATGEVYFPIVIETESNVLHRAGEEHGIKPGMVASVDILTGERTVLDYLLKPFRKARLEAMRER